MRVVIVDDAATTGGALVHSARCLREAGLDLEVVLAITLVDRLAGYEAAMAEIDVPVASVFTLNDFDDAGFNQDAGTLRQCAE